MGFAWIRKITRPCIYIERFSKSFNIKNLIFNQLYFCQVRRNWWHFFNDFIFLSFKQRLILQMFYIFWWYFQTVEKKLIKTRFLYQYCLSGDKAFLCDIKWIDNCAVSFNNFDKTQQKMLHQSLTDFYWKKFFYHVSKNTFFYGRYSSKGQ